MALSDYSGKKRFGTGLHFCKCLADVDSVSCLEPYNCSSFVLHLCDEFSILSSFELLKFASDRKRDFKINF